MSTVSYAFDAKFDVDVPLLIVGAGAAGLCAALAAKEAGIEPLVIERDAVPAGSTALSAGLIPAAGTRFQRAKGIIDSPQLFAADIARKAKGEADAAVVDAVAMAQACWWNGWRTATACRSTWSIISTIRAIRPCACTACRPGPGWS